MYEVTFRDKTIEAVFSASFEMVEKICRDVEIFSAKLGINNYSFQVQLAARELLTNAVRHGSSLNPELKVWFSLHFESDIITLHVKDEGPGFNWKAYVSRDLDQTAESGRGFKIIQLYFDSLVFNKSGNEITITKKITDSFKEDDWRPMMFDVSTDGNKTVVTIEGNIVASVVNELKTRLKEELDKEPEEFAIDMRQVEMLDSMGIGVLIAVHNTLKKRNKSLELVNCSSNISQLLKAMRLHQHLVIS